MNSDSLDFSGNNLYLFSWERYCAPGVTFVISKNELNRLSTIPADEFLRGDTVGYNMTNDLIERRNKLLRRPAAPPSRPQPAARAGARRPPPRAPAQFTDDPDGSDTEVTSLTSQQHSVVSSLRDGAQCPVYQPRAGRAQSAGAGAVRAFL